MPGSAPGRKGTALRDADGQWYLYFAKDVLDGDQPGTALAVCPLDGMKNLRGEAVPVRRDGLCHCFYPGGNWTNDTCGVGHAVAHHPLGPSSEPSALPVVLQSRPDALTGPGHNSAVTDDTGQDHPVLHAWNDAQTRRQLHVTRRTAEPNTNRSRARLLARSGGHARPHVRNSRQLTVHVHGARSFGGLPADGVR